MQRLSRTTLDRLPSTISAPRDRPPLATGILHFGPGAFHRAHQAVFVDTLLDADPRWGIAAVSLRSRKTTADLADQDGLYTLAIRDRAPATRVIGAHSAFFAPDDFTRILATLADPAVALVTATVTEKGYCLDATGELDPAHPDIAHDLAGHSPAPRSLVGWLVAGLAARRSAGQSPFVTMSCDNVANNGTKLHRALVQFARESGDDELARWIAGEVRSPNTMVDAITPASDPALYAQVSETLGFEDRAAVQREAFAQWVIEDVGPFGPDLASAGAIITGDVAGYERAKLRILNAAHSALAYLGLARGHTSVAEAMADPAIARLVEDMIRDEVVPVLPPVAGFDVGAYVASVFERFRNPAIIHRLDQIAQDGTQKLPIRLGDSIRAHRNAGRLPGRLLSVCGAWVSFVMRRFAASKPPIDPLADRMFPLVRGADSATVVQCFANEGIGIPAQLSGDDKALATIARAAEATVVLVNDTGFQ